MENSQLFYSLLIAIVAALPGIWASIQGRKKVIAEAEKAKTEADKLRIESGDIVRKATLELATQYKAQELEEKLQHERQMAEMDAMNIKLKATIADLREELRDAYVEIRRLNEALKIANRKLSE